MKNIKVIGYTNIYKWNFTMSGEGTVTITVSMERLKNSNNGAPRYKARIAVYGNNYTGDSETVYTFTGSYIQEETEAKEVAMYHLFKDVF